MVLKDNLRDILEEAKREGKVTYFSKERMSRTNEEIRKYMEENFLPDYYNRVFLSKLGAEKVYFPPSVLYN